jgi:hypothetical protein
MFQLLWVGESSWSAYVMKIELAKFSEASVTIFQFLYRQYPNAFNIHHHYTENLQSRKGQ